MAGFLARLKIFLQGEQRPVQRSVDVEGLGRLEFSDEAEAWCIEAAHAPCGFGFLICGNGNDRGRPAGIPRGRIPVPRCRDPERTLEPRGDRRIAHAAGL
jgi:hypothetical protein